jgi:hypothetical protein
MHPIRAGGVTWMHPWPERRPHFGDHTDSAARRIAAECPRDLFVPIGANLPAFFRPRGASVADTIGILAGRLVERSCRIVRRDSLRLHAEVAFAGPARDPRPRHLQSCRRCTQSLAAGRLLSQHLPCRRCHTGGPPPRTPRMARLAGAAPPCRFWKPPPSPAALLHAGAGEKLRFPLESCGAARRSGWRRTRQAGARQAAV